MMITHSFFTSLATLDSHDPLEMEVEKLTMGKYRVMMITHSFFTPLASLDSHDPLELEKLTMGK